MASFGSARDAARTWDATSYEGNEAVLDFDMGDREGRPYAVAHAGFPMASFGSARDAARTWDATSYEGNEAVLDFDMGDREGRPWASSPSCSGDRVGVTGLRPSPLPHHRTCGFLASGGWRRWTSPARCVHEVSFIQRFHSQPFACPVPAAYGRLARRNPPVGSPPAAVSLDGLSGNFRNGSGVRPLACLLAPSALRSSRFHRLPRYYGLC